MNATHIKKYLNNELDVIEKNQFEIEMEEDLFLKESIEGLKLWMKNNPTESLNSLEQTINSMLGL